MQETPTLSATKLEMHPELLVCNVDLNTGDTHKKLIRYYEQCCSAQDLIVTTSCFAVWKKGGSTNGHAKVIPAVPVTSFNQVKGIDQAIRVFFFDDNINLSTGILAGAPDAKGICNLRDVANNEYVDFSVGKNGFQCDPAYRHTLIHHSSEYRNVLVQANILDAMSNHDYFTSIILKYKKPGEKCIVYMDVNGTILWNDSIMGLGPDELLLGTMFGFTEIQPRRPFELTWDETHSVIVDRLWNLRELLHALSAGDERLFHDFWNVDECRILMDKLVQHADLKWCGKPGLVTTEEFFAVYRDYMMELHKQEKEQGAAACGITESWFRCCAALREGHHAPVINSFGMDTQKVVMRSARDPRKSPHFAINFEMWSERDSDKFKSQFMAEALPPPMAPTPPPSPRQRRMTRVAAPRHNSVDRPFVGDHAGDVLMRFLEGTHAFEFVIRKSSPDLALGAEVRHIESGLEIAKLLDEGAIKETSQLNLTMRPPGNAIKKGDIIFQVNSVQGDTRLMIQECKKVNVTLLILRPPFKELEFSETATGETEGMGATTGVHHQFRASKLFVPTNFPKHVNGGAGA